MKAPPTPSIYKQRTVTVEFLNLTGKGEGKTVIRMALSGFDDVEVVFFCLDSRTLGFGASSFLSFANVSPPRGFCWGIQN
jgi:hypothetical protein